MFLEELLLHKFFWYYLNVAFIFSKLNMTIAHQMRTKGLPSSYLDVFFSIRQFLLTNNRPVVHWFNVAFLFSYRKKASHFASLLAPPSA